VTLRKLHKKAWKVFSLWIRKRDKGVCYTCGRRFPIGELNAGHFIHKDCLDFDERNIHAQCVYCNFRLHGNLTKYAEHLIKQYGADIIGILNRLGDKVRKFKQQELLNIIEKYK
jgi:hypothetical protein